MPLGSLHSPPCFHTTESGSSFSLGPRQPSCSLPKAAPAHGCPEAGSWVETSKTQVGEHQYKTSRFSPPGRTRSPGGAPVPTDSPQLRVFRQELQFLGHHVPDLAVGEPGPRLHDHCVLVVHLECVGHGDAELYVLRGEKAEGLASVCGLLAATSCITGSVLCSRGGR